MLGNVRKLLLYCVSYDLSFHLDACSSVLAMFLSDDSVCTVCRHVYVCVFFLVSGFCGCMCVISAHVDLCGLM